MVDIPSNQQMEKSVKSSLANLVKGLLRFFSHIWTTNDLLNQIVCWIGLNRFCIDVLFLKGMVHK